MFKIIIERPEIEMFDPECQNIECPQCFFGKIYFDDEIGYYCMHCGNQFSDVDMEVLIEKIALTSRYERKSGSGRDKPVVQIRELPTRKAKAKHIGRDVIKSKRHDRQGLGS